MSKFLITGGAGYIGSTTASRLERNGHEIVVVDDLSRGHEHNVQPSRLRRVTLSDTEGLYRVMAEEKFDAVVHFAAYIAVGESTKLPELYFANNVGGSMSLLQAMMRAGIKRLVFSSTAAVYGNPERVPITEDQPFQPVSPYGESKVMVEKVLGWMDQFRELRSIALRYFNACGADPGVGPGRGTRPRDAPHSAAVPRDQNGAAGHDFRRRLRDERRHLHSRLHSCRRSCGCAHRRAQSPDERRAFRFLQRRNGDGPHRDGGRACRGRGHRQEGSLRGRTEARWRPAGAGRQLRKAAAVPAMGAEAFGHPNDRRRRVGIRPEKSLKRLEI